MGINNLASFINRSINMMIDLGIFALRGGVEAARRKGVTIGKDCRIYVRSFGSEPFLIQIGDRVTLTSGVRILTHDGSTGLVKNQNGRRYQRYAPVSIGNDVFIGINSIIMPGVTVGSNVVIGAGSVVTKNVPDGSVVAGNPAKLITSFEEFQKGISETCVNDSELDGIKTYESRVNIAIDLANKRAKKHSGQ